MMARQDDDDECNLCMYITTLLALSIYYLYWDVLGFIFIFGSMSSSSS